MRVHVCQPPQQRNHSQYRGTLAQRIQALNQFAPSLTSGDNGIDRYLACVITRMIKVHVCAHVCVRNKRSLCNSPVVLVWSML
jgi:hypothetical protein